MLAFSQGQISVFAQTVPGVGSTPPTAVRYALLLKELAAVTEGRATLEERVHRYQQAYTALKRRIDAQKGNPSSLVCFCCIYFPTFLYHIHSLFDIYLPITIQIDIFHRFRIMLHTNIKQEYQQKAMTLLAYDA
ncbi:hypothetical protein DPMN_004021 [Dreissena polymorpha]|uniref:Uncharacterized protein n=1 Tax=Dreissena polymorpha TaxID=45954 RepID=A0A9D4RVB1_DREPO|nr:hypothetical protein DPMN_004021 [Dreissena polymorpha]